MVQNAPTKDRLQRHRMPAREEVLDLSKIPPPPSMPLPKPHRPGERTISTTDRLRRQGLTRAKSSSADFAVRSIRHGSQDWTDLIKPFVSDLAFQSVVCRRSQSEVSFRPYTCHAAVLFVDLSSYSKIAATVAHRGAHALSSVVNAYLDRILHIVHANGGDVVKYAGDAVLIVWEGAEQELELNVLCAAKCVLEMQEKAGSHPVTGTDLSFRIHCGLACGQLESEIFAAPTHQNMQRLYHSVGGETLEDISELVDLAKAGEVCISEDCVAFIGDRGKCRDVVGDDGAKLLTTMNLDPEFLAAIDDHVEKSLADRMARRNKDIEEEFIHPSVLRFLTHGGFTPTQIAQMRNLCVLFVAMTSSGNSVNWLMEVQSSMDKHRCPIVQIIDDDKGVHVVAAVNLYEAVPEASLLGLEVCKELVDKQVGCAIGIAKGGCFCGVTGSSSVACRWDITGPPAVRAARLMQYALLNEVEVAIDQSVYNDPLATSRIEVLDCKVSLKGTDTLCPVYTLSDSTNYSAFRVLETVHGSVHDDAVREIQAHINGERSRCAVLVTGAPLAGKTIVCQRAAGYADLVPFLHNSSETAGLLQLARTMATWFKYVDCDDVRYLAAEVLDHLDHSRWSRAHDQCIRLVNFAIEEGLRACFLVHRIHFLDDFSFSLIRECLHGRRKTKRFLSSVSDRSERSDALSESIASNGDGNGNGRICFLCVHSALYNYMPASDVVEQITRSHKRLNVPIINIGEASDEELRVMFRDLGDIGISDRCLSVMAEDCGRCAGYFVERIAAIYKLSGKRWTEGKRGLGETTQELILDIPRGNIGHFRSLSVMEVSAEVAMRFSQIYDDLPPLFQVFSKILAIATRKQFFKLPRSIMWEVINDIVSEGVEADAMSVVLDEMKEMFLLKAEFENYQELLSFQSPALADIALDVCVPVQVESIANALIERLDPVLSTNFRIPFVVADLHGRFRHRESIQKRLWLRGYKAFLTESKDMSEDDSDRYKEQIQDEIEAAGFDIEEVLGCGFFFSRDEIVGAGHQISLLHAYQAPISFGPMGHSLSVVCRNTAQELKFFHGAHDAEVSRIRRATASASRRYLDEAEVVEEFLGRYGLRASRGELQWERDMMESINKPSENVEQVQEKAAKILDDFIPNIVDNRLRRLRTLVTELHKEGMPEAVKNGPKALWCAYQALQVSKNRNDAAQDAIMTLATMNWKPRPVPEHLPILYYQTVARIRNKVFRRLSDAELLFFRHQHRVDDLEVFLVVTPLLYEAQETGRC